MQTLGRDKGTMTTTSSIYRPRFPRNDQQEDAYRELSRDFTLLVDAISLSLSLLTSGKDCSRRIRIEIEINSFGFYSTQARAVERVYDIDLYV